MRSNRLRRRIALLATLATWSAAAFAQQPAPAPAEAQAPAAAAVPAEAPAASPAPPAADAQPPAAAAPAPSPAAASTERITLGDLRTPVRPLLREEVEQLVYGAVMARRREGRPPQRWTNQPDGTLAAPSFTRQGRPLTEYGVWRVNEQGQYCVSIVWLAEPLEAWCRHVVRNRDGHYLAEGLQLGDAVERYEVQVVR